MGDFYRSVKRTGAIEREAVERERARIRREIEPVIAEMRSWWREGGPGLSNSDPDKWADRLERALGGEDG